MANLGIALEVRSMRSLGEPQASFKAALWAWLLREGRVGFTDIRELLLKEKDSWVVKDVIGHLTAEHIGEPSYEALLNIGISIPNGDANRVAAVRIVEENLAVTVPYREIAEAAKPDLFAGGKIKRIGKAPSLVGQVLGNILQCNFGTFDWARLLRSKHAHAERIAFSVQRHFETGY